MTVVVVYTYCNNWWFGNYTCVNVDIQVYILCAHRIWRLTGEYLEILIDSGEWLWEIWIDDLEKLKYGLKQLYQDKISVRYQLCDEVVVFIHFRRNWARWQYLCELLIYNIYLNFEERICNCIYKVHVGEYYWWYVTYGSDDSDPLLLKDLTSSV